MLKPFIAVSGRQSAINWQPGSTAYLNMMHPLAGIRSATEAYLELRLISSARWFSPRSDVCWQVCHPSGLLYEVVEGAEAAQLHHNCQLHSRGVKAVCLHQPHVLSAGYTQRAHALKSTITAAEAIKLHNIFDQVSICVRQSPFSEFALQVLLHFYKSHVVPVSALESRGQHCGHSISFRSSLTRQKTKGCLGSMDQCLKLVYQTLCAQCHLLRSLLSVKFADVQHPDLLRLGLTRRYGCSCGEAGSAIIDWGI